MREASTHAAEGASDASIAFFLDRIDRRLERLEAKLSYLEREAPKLVATAADTLDQLSARLSDEGVDIEARFSTLLSLLNQVSDPSVSRVLSSLLSRTSQLEQALQLAGQAPAMISMLTDIADGFAMRLGARGVDLHDRALVLLRLLEHLSSPQTAEAVDALLGSGLLGPRTLVLIRHAADALQRTIEAGPSPVGLWGAMKSMRDEEVKSAVGLFLSLAKSLGHALQASHEEKQLPPAP